MVELVARLVVGGYLIARSVGVLRSVSVWRQVWLAVAQLVPARLVGPVATFVPIAELITGITVVLGAFRVVAVPAAAALLALSTAAFGVAHARGLVLAAGRLSRLRPLTSRYAVLRNALFVVALVATVGRGGDFATLARFDSLTQAVTVLAVLGAVSVLIVMSRRARRERLPAELVSA
ncbi:MauE/DoxX family redox-associated membrane protein [Nocardia sp. NPDC004068]|uniref:MauE/DoxX family redox-associated membrane protein n=1 Tax=Nocardia sp. NPDC004068 TaxID=3364303 RepID=UPI0036B42010